MPSAVRIVDVGNVTSRADRVCLRRLFPNRDSLHQDVFERAILWAPTSDSIDGDLANCVDDFDSRDDSADHAVATVDAAIVGVHDEKLAAGGIRVSPVCHADDAADEGCKAELVGDADIVDSVSIVVWIAVPGVCIAALDHEAGDDAMEGRSVVIAVLREIDYVGDGFRRQLGHEFDHDRAFVFSEDIASATFDFERQSRVAWIDRPFEAGRGRRVDLSVTPRFDAIAGSRHGEGKEYSKQGEDPRCAGADRIVRRAFG